MIRINQNNPEELVINKEDLKKLELLNDENTVLAFKTLFDIKRYEEANRMSLQDIRVKRDTSLGKVLFEVARQEIIADGSEVVPSILFLAAQVPNVDYLTQVELLLKQEETNPSDIMVEQILISRNQKSVNPELAPFCVEENGKILEKSGNF